MDIKDETVLARIKSVVGADAGGMHVLLNDELRYLGVQEVGLSIWELLEQPQTYSELITALVAQYDVSVEQCRSDVQPFLGKLIEHQLVAVR